MKMTGTLTDEQAKEMCICGNCPSYVDCGELAFCIESVGKSKCINKEKGCICGGCPVHKILGLKHMFYCTRGSENQQIKK
jgi:hypothetical protein